MGEFFPIHWLLVILVILLLFGGRKIPEMMKGLGEGIRSFKEGMKGDGSAPVASATTAPVPPPAPPVTPVATNPPTQEKPH
jgi:sec-independent protein translocase protein TatA